MVDLTEGLSNDRRSYIDHAANKARVMDRVEVTTRNVRLPRTTSKKPPKPRNENTQSTSTTS